MSIDARFLGTGWSFPPAFDWRTKEAVMVSQEQDIEESLRILLSTVPGERVMQPSYGCGLQRMVFENINESTLTEIRSLVEKAVLFFEVRITLHEVQIDTAELFEGALRLRLEYTIRTTNTRNNMVYPLYLREGTGLRGTR
ncbi:GPW/gp25 family protein [Piscinibacter sp.]|uniref:GPW/gp25 family protein n=1 Tax=Piscinibacter sp. TaxID=1903157 RepID=UPI002BDFA795|nr:GPW/gp25 family protein [Albitalea sp.]HUG26165.1 GPW/gp25 family protein [Albitalea sp.]